jgi:hypothetical protein
VHQNQEFQVQGAEKEGSAAVFSKILKENQYFSVR